MAILGSTALQGQKRVRRTFLDPAVESVVIDGSQCYQLLLETADTREVLVEAEMDGEYQNEVVVFAETLGTTLRIGTGLAPTFEMPNDKLGAHKVLSVKLRVVLPPNQQVSFASGNCQVTTRGTYRGLKIHITGGGCLLAHTAENTEVLTASAPIRAQIARGQVAAHSRYGHVEQESIPVGPARFKLNSTTGNIQITRNL